MKTYRAAIIGCGRIGSEFDNKKRPAAAMSHAGAYTVCTKTELTAACDCKPGKLAAFEKKWGKGSLYLDYKKMLKSERIDILSICTPAQTHWPLIRQAAKFPIRAIYCEKPISDSSKDAKKIIKLCRTRKILLTVNHQRRFDPFHQELRKRITDGSLGRVQQVNCYYTRGIFNTGTHVLDLFCFLFGRPMWAQAIYSQNKSNFKNDPNLDGIIKFENGPLIIMRACDDSNYLIFEIDILAGRARLRLGAEFEYFKVNPGSNLLKKKQLVKVKKAPFRSAYGVNSLTNGVRHIINCLEKKEEPLSSGEDAVEALKVIESMCASAAAKKVFS